MDSIPLAILETNNFVPYQPFTLPRVEFLSERKEVKPLPPVSFIGNDLELQRSITSFNYGFKRQCFSNKSS